MPAATASRIGRLPVSRPLHLGFRTFTGAAPLIAAQEHRIFRKSDLLVELSREMGGVAFSSSHVHVLGTGRIFFSSYCVGPLEIIEFDPINAEIAASRDRTLDKLSQGKRQHRNIARHESYYEGTWTRSDSDERATGKLVPQLIQRNWPKHGIRHAQ